MIIIDGVESYPPASPTQGMVLVVDSEPNGAFVEFEQGDIVCYVDKWYLILPKLVAQRNKFMIEDKEKGLLYEFQLEPNPESL